MLPNNIGGESIKGKWTLRPNNLCTLPRYISHDLHSIPSKYINLLTFGVQDEYLFVKEK